MAPPTVVTPYRQEPQVAGLAFYVRTSLPAERTLRDVPAAVARLDRNLPVATLKTLSQQAREDVYLDRMVGTLSAGFAALATLLAAVWGSTAGSRTRSPVARARSACAWR